MRPRRWRRGSRNLIEASTTAARPVTARLAVGGRLQPAARTGSELLLQSDDERGATVEPTRLFARVVVLRTLLTIADRRQPAHGDPVAHQVVAHRVGAALAEREVVLGRPDIA